MVIQLLTKTQWLVNTIGNDNTAVGFIYKKLVISTVLPYTTTGYNTWIENTTGNNNTAVGKNYW